MTTVINSAPVIVNFQWDMNRSELAALYEARPDLTETYDYCGAVFFGNYKLEFIQNADGGYLNLFEYGANECCCYDWLEDGTPYADLPDEASEIVRPHRRTFSAFARDIERQIFDMLRAHPGMIPFATVETDPGKWYPGERAQFAPATMTRNV